jgi:hypothetical protein
MRKKNPIIQLPLSLTLTDEGKYFFNRRRQNALEKSGNFVGDEIKLSSYQARTLQRLVYAGYVSRIELTRTDFLSKRIEIMDVAKLIVYAILYKKFGMTLGKELTDSALVSLWNRKHPRQALNETSLIGDHQGGSGTEEFRDLIQMSARRSVSDLMMEDGSFSPEEEKIAVLKAENFLESLNPLLWALLVKQKEGRPRSVVCNEIEMVLKVFLRKTLIADYLSLLIMELAAYAETSLIRRVLADDPDSRIDFAMVVHNERLRRELLKRLEKANRGATLAWRLQSERFTIGKDTSTHIILYNRELNRNTIRKEIEDSTAAGVGGIDLADFYHREENEPTGKLGLSYLSYLREACSTLGVRFNSHVNYIADLDLTLINLTVRF